eukprot:PhF_6_TR2266/c0_g1_i2/m.3917
MPFSSLFLLFFVVPFVVCDPATFDCAWRKYAYEYANKIQPWHAPHESVYSALQLGPLCNVSLPNPKHSTSTTSTPTHLHASPQNGCVYDVYPERSQEDFSYALDDIYRRRAMGDQRHIYIRFHVGTHYMCEEGMQLTPMHSNITMISVISNVTNDPLNNATIATISGGRKLSGLQWQKYNLSRFPSANVWVANLSKFRLKSLPGLTLNGRRVFRARYPNCDPETTIPDVRVNGNMVQWHPPLPSPPPTYIAVQSPQRDWMEQFQMYTAGTGGRCSMYDPPTSYWCSQYPRGYPTDDYTARAPSGVTIPLGLFPNMPYQYSTQDMIINAYRPDLWFTLMWNISSSNGTSFYFDKGGFQGAEGQDTASNFYIENVMDELDSPNEYFYNRTTGMLYLYYNGTGAPPAEAHLVAAQARTLLSFQGDSQQRPIVGVTVFGLRFTSTIATYMDPHGIPSGGDWALQRSGAIFLENTEDITIKECILEGLDGNAIMISGYNRRTLITKNNIMWTGDTAIAAWGYTDDMSPNGIDGTAGNVPLGVNISFNLLHEVGLYQKQSSFYFQAKTALTVIQGNIMFNTPRAGVNFNDGFGGGNEMFDNLIFNTCRETADHGPFNSWDRVPFLTTLYDGTPSLKVLWNHFHHNFMVANYFGQEAIDNDDGSGYYNIYANFFVYGQQGLKSDFGGHDIVHTGNIYAYPRESCGDDGAVQFTGHNDIFANNTCILGIQQNNATPYITYNCALVNATTSMMKVSGNKVYGPGGVVYECGMPLAQWQQTTGLDPNTVGFDLPSDDEIIGWARQLLGV